MAELPKAVPQFYRKIEPVVLDCDFAKMVAALQAFSNPEAGEKFHILFVGDPASAKSRILKYMIRIIPNSGYVGRRTTPIGLAEELAKCNRGILGIEEFDKLPKSIRDSLLEVMEDQQIKVTKHGNSYALPAPTNILAVCNPKHYILNEIEPLHTQLSFYEDKALLTRFALIIPFKALGSDRYADIAESGNIDDEKVAEEQVELKKQISQIKRLIPKVIIPKGMDREAGEFVAGLKEWSPMREILSARTIHNNIIPAIKARARMMLHSTAKEEDFEYVKGIFEEAYGELK